MLDKVLGPDHFPVHLALLLSYALVLFLKPEGELTFALLEFLNIELHCFFKHLFR